MSLYSLSRWRVTLVALEVVCVGCLLAPATARAQGYSRWILAEGADNAFFEEDVLIANPNPTDAQVKLTFFPEVGDPVDRTVTVKATSRYTFSVKELDPRPGSASAVIECLGGCDIVVERSMYWRPDNHRRGGHNSQGVTSGAKKWYLAEGSSGGIFTTFILYINPSLTDTAHVTSTFLRDGLPPATLTFNIPPGRRKTLPAYEVPAIANANFSTVVDSDVDIVVERAMYWGEYEAGHESVAVKAPSPEWYFAEGSTGASPLFDFQTYLLIGNPNASEFDAVVTFFKDNGEQVVHNVPLKANSRTTVFVDAIPGLESTSFSFKVIAPQPVIAERAMYWTSNGIVWVDGHNTPGVTALAPKWGFAEGGEGRLDASAVSYDSFFLVANANAAPLPLKFTFMLEDGTGFAFRHTIPANTRYTLGTSQFPELSHQKFATFVESEDGQPFVAERAMYWGELYYGGHASTGTPWTGVIGVPAPVNLTPVISTVTPSSGSTAGNTRVTITGTRFTELSTVAFGGIPARDVEVFDSTIIRATTAPSPTFGPIPVTVTNPGNQTGTLAGGFTYEKPAPVEPTTRADHTLSFGDSITYGTTAHDHVTTGYPQRLQDLLAAKYPTQTINVDRSGIPGERATGGGRSRLNSLLSGGHDLVIILEGINDLNGGISPSSVANALRQMVQNAKAAGKLVILSSLTPTAGDYDADVQAAIVELNNLINQIASSENVPRVDMFSAFGGNPDAFVSTDNLHPNDAGYQRMAQAFYGKILERFEIVP